MEINISDLVPPNFYNTFGSKAAHQIESGGRISLKTSICSLKLALYVIGHKNISAVVIKKYAKSLRDGSFKEIQRAFMRLGQGHNIKVGKHILEITYLPNGNKIKFYGSDTPNKLKDIIGDVEKNDDKPIKVVWFEELQEFWDKKSPGKELISTTAKTFIRTNPMYLYSFNPPSFSNHGIYEWLKDMFKVHGVSPHHSTIYDIPELFIKKWDLVEAKQLAIAESIAIPNDHKNTWLGLTVDLGTNPFLKYLTDDIWIDKAPEHKSHYIGIDLSSFKNRTIAVYSKFTTNYENVIIDRVHRVPFEETNDICDNLADFINDKNCDANVDAGSLGKVIFKTLDRIVNKVVRPVDKTKLNSRQNRLTMMLQLLEAKRIKFVKNEGTELLVDNLKKLMLDKDDGTIVDDNLVENDFYDAFCYSVMFYTNELLRR